MYNDMAAAFDRPLRSPHMGVCNMRVESPYMGVRNTMPEVKHLGIIRRG